jgi:hypothetical protein
MAWWRRDKQAKPDPSSAPGQASAADLSDAIRHEQLRQQHRELKSKNDYHAKMEAERVRQQERDWLRQPWLLRRAPPNPAWPIKRDKDGLATRLAKGFVNREAHEYGIYFRKWQRESEERRHERDAQRQAKAQAAQARQQRPAQPRPAPPRVRPSGSGSGSAADPFIMGDDSRVNPLHAMAGAQPAPEPARSRGRGR